MPKDYRPRIIPGSNKAKGLLKAGQLALKHPDEFTDLELEGVLEFITELDGRDLVATAIQVLRGKIQIDDDPEKELEPYAEDTNFKDWNNLDDLMHRLWEHQDNYLRGKLSEDDLFQLTTRIEQLEVRAREAGIQRIRPSSDNSSGEFEVEPEDADDAVEQQT